jgi:hypothetical protein
VTLYTKIPLRQGFLDEFESATGEVISATLQKQWYENPVMSLERAAEYDSALLGEVVPYTEYDDLGSPEYLPTEQKRLPPEGPILTEQEVRDRWKEEELEGIADIEIPKGGMPKRALDLLVKWRREDIALQDKFQRAPDSIGLKALQFGAALAASVPDPLNIAAGFIPLVGPVRYAAMLGRAGGALGRAGVRARIGAMEGAVGAAIVEPIVYASQQRIQADYDVWDSILNIALGSALGGGLHMGIGAVGDATVWRGRDWTEGVRGEIRAATPEERQAALMSSIAQDAMGLDIDVRPIFPDTAVRTTTAPWEEFRLPETFRRLVPEEEVQGPRRPDFIDNLEGQLQAQRVQSFIEFQEARLAEIDSKDFKAKTKKIAEGEHEVTVGGAPLDQRIQKTDAGWEFAGSRFKTFQEARRQALQDAEAVRSNRAVNLRQEIDAAKQRLKELPEVTLDPLRLQQEARKLSGPRAIKTEEVKKTFTAPEAASLVDMDFKAEYDARHAEIPDDAVSDDFVTTLEEDVKTRAEALGVDVDEAMALDPESELAVGIDKHARRQGRMVRAMALCRLTRGT